MTKLSHSNPSQKSTFSQTARTYNLCPKEFAVNNLMSNRKGILSSVLNTISTKGTSSTTVCCLL